MLLRYYVIRRLLESFITLLFVVLVAFILIHLALMREPAKIAAEFGGSTSLLYQYYIFLSNLFTLNFGYIPPSFPIFPGYGVAYVMSLLLPDTMQLILIATLIALLISIPMGTAAGISKGSSWDNVTRIYSFFFYGMPIVFTALIIQLLFAKGGVLGTGLPDTGAYTAGLTIPHFVKYGVTYPTHVPIIDGLVNGDFSFALGAFLHLLMPSLVLAFWTSAAMSRFLRGSINEHVNDPHIIAANSRGLPRRIIVKRYIRRNSYIPFLTVLGPIFTGLISWEVVTEIIFGYPGIGIFIVDSDLFYYVNGLAYGMLILGIVLISFNFIADILYVFLDPQIRY